MDRSWKSTIAHDAYHLMVMLFVKASAHFPGHVW